MSKTSKIFDLIISEPRRRYPRYLRFFIYTLLALTEVWKKFPDIRLFSMIWGVQLTSHQPEQISFNIRAYNPELRDQGQKYLGSFIYTFLALTKVKEKFPDIRLFFR